MTQANRGPSTTPRYYRFKNNSVHILVFASKQKIIRQAEILSDGFLVLMF